MGHIKNDLHRFFWKWNGELGVPRMCLWNRESLNDKHRNSDLELWFCSGECIFLVIAVLNEKTKYLEKILNEEFPI